MSDVRERAPARLVRRRAVAVVGSFALTFLFACVGDAPIAGPGADAAAPDAGPVEGGALDAAASDGASPDAGFCGSRPGAVYCQDFDGVTTPSDVGVVKKQGTVTLAIDGKDSSSAPNALVALTDGAQNPQSATVVKLLPPLGAPSKVVLEFAMRCTAPPDSVQTAGAGLIFTQGLELHQVVTLVGQGLLTINEGYIPPDGGGFVGLPGANASFDCAASTKYRRITVAIEVGQPSTATLAVDGAVVATLTLTSGFAFLPSASVQMGVGYNNGGAKVSVSIDDVVVSTK